MVGYFDTVQWSHAACARQSPPASANCRGRSNGKNPAGINVDKGNWDPATDATNWPSPIQVLSTRSEVKNYAARPASNHPGGVIVAFVGGNTRFLREDIDYPVYCLLMTSDGANCTGPRTSKYTQTRTTPTTTVGRSTKCWMKAACKRACAHFGLNYEAQGLQPLGFFHAPRRSEVRSGLSGGNNDGGGRRQRPESASAECAWRCAQTANGPGHSDGRRREVVVPR